MQLPDEEKSAPVRAKTTENVGFIGFTLHSTKVRTPNEKYGNPVWTRTKMI
jgi:hypothetical protein